MRALIEQIQLSNKQPLPPRNRQRRPFVDQGSYYWTHGYAVTRNHNSQTCRTKGPGTKTRQPEITIWVAANEENNKRDNGGRSVHSTITV
jgi:hypothetical protein